VTHKKLYQHNQWLSKAMSEPTQTNLEFEGDSLRSISQWDKAYPTTNEADPVNTHRPLQLSSTKTMDVIKRAAMDEIPPKMRANLRE
jgi:uncharacterized protein (DUF2342 family)